MEPKKAAPKIEEGPRPYLPSEDGFDGGIAAADPGVRYVGADPQSAAALGRASKAITQLSQLDSDAWYSYEDYCTWQFPERVELIYGKVYVMSPSPGRVHQESGGEIFRQVANHLLGRACKVYLAPFDVQLLQDATDGKVFTVLQPDLCIVCDATKLSEKGCTGAPDLVLEVLSASTSKHDLVFKFGIYELNNIKELWYLDNAKSTLTVHILQADGLYGPPVVYAANAKVPVATLPGLHIDLSLVFPDAETDKLGTEVLEG